MASYGWEELYFALQESVKLQSHYAALLNMHDGGERLVFNSPEEWLQRLRKLDDEEEKRSRAK